MDYKFVVIRRVHNVFSTECTIGMVEGDLK